MAIPVKPSPGREVQRVRVRRAEQLRHADQPATAPEMSMVTRIIFLTFTPLATAAGSDCPVARTS